MRNGALGGSMVLHAELRAVRVAGLGSDQVVAPRAVAVEDVEAIDELFFA